MHNAVAIACVVLVGVLGFLLAIVFGLVVLLILSVGFQTVAIRRMRISRPHAEFVTGSDVEQEARVATVFAEAAAWAAANGFLAESTFRETPPIIGAPASPGRSWFNADSGTRLFVYVPPRRLGSPTRQSQFTTWLDDENCLETLSGYGSLRLLTWPERRSIDVIGDSLDAQWHFHRERLADITAPPQPEPAEHAARIARRFDSTLDAAVAAGDFVRATDGSVHPRWRHAWRLARKRMQGAAAIAEARRSSKNGAGVVLSTLPKRPFPKRAFAVLLLCLFALLWIRYLPRTDPEARYAETMNVDARIEEIRKTTTWPDAARLSLSAVHDFTEVGDETAVRKILVSAEPALASTGWPASERARVLAGIATELMMLDDEKRASEIQEEVLAFAERAVQACTHASAHAGCAAPAHLALARATRRIKGDKTYRRELLATLADARAAPDSYRDELIDASDALAELEFIENHDQRALELWKDVVLLTRDDDFRKVDAYLQVATQLRRAGRTDEAITTLRAAGDVAWPDYRRDDIARAIRLNIGWWQLEDGRLDDARDTLNAGNHNKSDDVDSLMLAWNIARARGDDADAKRALDQLLALRAMPENPEYRNEYFLEFGSGPTVTGGPAVKENWHRLCATVSSLGELQSSERSRNAARAASIDRLLGKTPKMCAAVMRSDGP